jgi:hypothetical protein
MSAWLKTLHGERVAGGILVLHAALALVGSFCRQMLAPVPRVVAIIDLALGASLLSGRGWRAIALMRCVLGAVVLTGFEIVEGHPQVMNDDWAAATTEALYSAGLVALLIGRPSIPRIVAGALASSIAVADRILYLFSRRAF